MFRRHLLVAASACVCAAITVLGPEQVKYPFAVLLLAFLPGTAFTDAVFGSRLRDGTERVLTSIATSLAIVMLSGLVLDGAWTLTRTSIACTTAGVTVVLAGVSLLRARRSTAPFEQAREKRTRVPVWQALLMVGAAVLAVAAVGYARRPLSAKGVQGYTVLWVQPVASKLDYGVKSQELRSTQYRLDVHAGGRLVHRWRIALAPGSTWKGTIGPLLAPRVVDAELYRLQGDTWIRYRSVKSVQRTLYPKPA